MEEEIMDAIAYEEWQKLLFILKNNGGQMTHDCFEDILIRKVVYLVDKDHKHLPLIEPVIAACAFKSEAFVAIPYAVICNDEKAIERLISEGHYIDEVVQRGINGLIAAVLMDNISLVHYFIAKGAYIDFQDDENFTALDHSSNKAITTLLRNNGGKYNAEIQEELDGILEAKTRWSKTIKGYCDELRKNPTFTIGDRQKLFHQLIVQNNRP